MFSATKGGSTAGYQISRSVRLRSSASATFSRTPASAGSTTKGTFSFWIKRGTLSTAQQIYHVAGTSGNNSRFFLAYNVTTDTFSIVGYSSAGAVALELVTTQVFRDPSSWYHIVIYIDTTQASSSNRVILYINGAQVSSFGTSTIPAQNTALGFTNNTASLIGANQGSTNFFDGYLTEINFIDGQALTPSSFGQTNYITGVWSPIKYTGTYGTNGFYLNFSDNSAATAATIGKDFSGNGNNWTPNNISVTAGATYDSMLDVPTQWADGGNGRGNYCVMSPISAQGNTVADGNLKVTLIASLLAGYGARGTMAARSGDKFYWEVTPTTSTSVFTAIGINDAAYRFGADFAAAGSNCVLYYKSSGNKIVNGATSAYGTTYAANDVIGIALDYVANTCTFYLNNVSQGAISLPSTTIEYVPVVGNENGVADVFQVNFGQRPFSYTPPTGFRALNTLNLPTPTILKGNQYMDATLYTGNGSTLSVTNSGGMQPDLVWLKARSIAESHELQDAVRGATNVLKSNSTAAEITAANTLTSFNSNGFSLSSSTEINTNAATYVAWQWKEGATQGFDIVTYTGTGANRTVAHSLGVAPSMMIIKNRTTAGLAWIVYHASLPTPSTQAVYLNTTDPVQNSALFWNSTAPTSSVFSLAAYNPTNQNTNNMVAYLFAEVAGFSRFGSYTGNGSSDGPMIFTGFLPRFVMVKRTDTTQNWFMLDTARNTSNAVDNYLMANTSDADATFSPSQIDFISNGFKLRGTAAGLNANGGTYIFAAFAESPFKTSLAR
jgi:hypothetical protein